MTIEQAKKEAEEMRDHYKKPFHVIVLGEEEFWVCTPDAYREHWKGKLIVKTIGE